LRIDRFTLTIVALNCATPAALLGWDAASGGLGPDPVKFSIHTTGLLALIFLLLTLAVTPAARISGFWQLGRLRRLLGLCSFFYAALHAYLFYAFDRSGNLGDTLVEILNRRYLWVGALALAMMAPLAATSTDAMVRRLGGRRWKRLHRLVYVIAVAAVLHYYMQVKADTTWPLAFAGVLGMLLAYRGGESLRKRLSRARRGPVAAPAPARVPAAAIATITFERSGKSVALEGDQTVLEAAESAGVAIAYDCRSGTCGTCKVRLISGQVAMDCEAALEPADREQNLILSCQARCQGPVVLEA